MKTDSPNWTTSIMALHNSTACKVISMCNLNTSWELDTLKLALKGGHSTSNLIFQENVRHLYTNTCFIPENLHFPLEWSLHLSIMIPLQPSQNLQGAAQVENQSWTPRPILNHPHFSHLPLRLHLFTLKINKYIKSKQRNKQTKKKPLKEKGKMENWGGKE